jgi:hypothetical protein
MFGSTNIWGLAEELFPQISQAFFDCLHLQLQIS